MRENQKKYGVTNKELEEILSESRAKLVVVGVGGAGGNVVDLIKKNKLEGVETISINTDAQDLLKINADTKILIGKRITGGLGAGSDPIIGEAAVKEDEEEIREALGGADLTFIVAGLGGGTGTGASPTIASLARESGSVVMTIVFFPFSVEGAKRQEIALNSLKNFLTNSDTFVLIPNDKILELKPGISLKEGIYYANKAVTDLIKNLVEIIEAPTTINVDFADLRTVLEEGGISTFTSLEINDFNKLEEITKQVLVNPLIEVETSGGKKALLFIKTSSSVEIEKISSLLESVVSQLDPNAQVIWGANIVEDDSSKTKVFSIITGVKLLNIKIEEVVAKPKPSIDLGIDLESL